MSRPIAMFRCGCSCAYKFGKHYVDLFSASVIMCVFAAAVFQFSIRIEFDKMRVRENENDPAFHLILRAFPIFTAKTFIGQPSE